MLFVCLAMLGVQLVNAQQKTITGKVTSSEDGSTVPGVSVAVKGTTLGTITNMDGQYSLSVPENATILVFSFVGMTSKEVPIGASNVIDVSMVPGVFSVDEVVVTALGISREKKSLGYSVQEIAGDDVNNVKSPSFVNSLAGKVAGLKVKANNNMGGSSDVIIRGSNSLFGNNQALFVIDGVPVDNSNTNPSSQTSGRNGFDYGNAANDINPNDIESMSVLKGAAATALYGSRAANGVILITTKKGSKSEKGGALGVSLSSNVTIGVIDRSTFPEYQDKYGAGYGPYYASADGYFDEEDPFGDGVGLCVPYYDDASYGGILDGKLVYQWDAFHPESPNYGKLTPYVAHIDDKTGPLSFFNNSVGLTNSIDVSGATDRATYRLSYTNLDQTGIMPNSSLKKNNYTFNGSYDITKNLKLSSSATYNNTRGKGRMETGYNDNIMSSFRQWHQVNVDISMQKKMYELTGENVTWNRKSYENGEPNFWDNPYWLRYENYETDERNRLIGYSQLDWKATEYLSFMGRASIDTYNELQEERKAVGSKAGEFGVGIGGVRTDVASGYSRFQRTWMETNVDVLAKFNKNLGEDLNLNAIVGTNIRRSKMDRVFASTNGGLAIPNLYSLNNSADPMLPPEERLELIGVNGIFGSLSVGYKNMLFVDATLRRDQSSTLPAKDNSYLYPSVSTSFIFSNLVDFSWLSLGKIRANYAEVGNDAPALRVKDTYRGKAPMGTSLAYVFDVKNNPDLKSERAKSWELGLDMNFFKSRLGFDFAYYKTNTINQLIPLDISAATGYLSKWINAGEIQNNGLELSLFATPYKTNDFKWDVVLNWSKNTSKVLELYVDESGNKVTNLQIASLQGSVSINARVGEAYGSIHGTDYLYTPDGKRIVEGGYWAQSAGSDEVIGNVNPDWIGGINNAFTYKDLTLSFLIDWQKGGDVFSLDKYYGDGTGIYKESAANNELGNPKRDPITWIDENDPLLGYAANSGGILLDGVVDDGTGVYVPNTERIDGNTYYTEGSESDPAKKYVYDASFVKLREVVLTYNLPKKIMEKTFIEGASLSFVGSNLWIIHKNLPYADPEASQSNGNTQGWQSGVLPTTRNYGFSIKLQF